MTGMKRDQQKVKEMNGVVSATLSRQDQSEETTHDEVQEPNKAGQQDDGDHYHDGVIDKLPILLKARFFRVPGPGGLLELDLHFP